MSSKSLCLWIRCSIIAVTAGTVVLCAVWYPAAFSLINISFIPAISPEPTSMQLWSMLVFFWLCALPCLFILALCWKISIAVKKEEFFTVKSAKLIKLCAVIFFIDLGVFFIGNLIFLCLGINHFAILHFGLFIGGTVLGVFASALSHYVAKAAAIKEENEGTI